MLHSFVLSIPEKGSHKQVLYDLGFLRRSCADVLSKLQVSLNILRNLWAQREIRNDFGFCACPVKFWLPTYFLESHIHSSQWCSSSLTKIWKLNEPFYRSYKRTYWVYQVYLFCQSNEKSCSHGIRRGKTCSQIGFVCISARWTFWLQLLSFWNSGFSGFPRVFPTISGQIT